MSKFNLNVNGQKRIVDSHPDTPLLYILRNKLKLKGVKHGCGSEQCGACKVIIDGQAVPTCKLPVKNVQGLSITTIEGLGSLENLHHLQQAFIEEQAFQCGYCTPGMIVAAAGLLNRTRYPGDDEIREALKNNLCRCGVYNRVRRAIKLSTGREEGNTKYDVRVKPLEIPDFNHLPSTLIRTPDLDSWLRINDDQTITVFTGKVELGQGIKTAVAMIVAEELDVSLDRILVADTDSSYSPDEGLTVSSMSLETTGEALRWAAAEVRQIMLSVAMEELEAQPEHLEIANGIIRDVSSGKSTDYWQLFGGKPFASLVTGQAKPKLADQYSILGQGNYRLDSTAKVCGTSNFVHDLDLPGMVHGRVLRTTNQSAKLAAFDQQKMQSLPGLLRIVQDGSFIGVICEQEQQAIDALATLEQSVAWQQPDLPPGRDQIYDDLINQPGQSFLVKQGTPVEDAIPAIEIPGSAVQTLQADYYRPFQMHASLGPSAAAALLSGDNLTLWVHSQGVYPIRAAIARVLGMQTDQIHVIHVEGAGCYGHNGADDAALDAALLARACPGRPVLLKWTRENEHTWEPYGSAMVIKLQASLDGSGEVLDWNHDIWSYPHLGRSRSAESTSGLLAAWQLGQPFLKPTLEPVLAPHVGSHRNADPLYKFPRKRIVKHFIPESPLRTSALRSLGAFVNVFAIESFVDELAHSAGLDPVEFRLKYLQDERARDVIQAAADKSGWGDSKQQEKEKHGWGIAFAQYKNRQCYAAVAVELNINLETGQITLEQAVIAADAGQIVSADGLSNQLEGSFTQAASWTLYEQVTFDQQGITSRDWDTYPILKINQAPRIKTILINRPGLPFLGAGEAAQGPTPAAIANAIFDATGLRLRKIPFTPSAVKSALQHSNAV